MSDLIVNGTRTAREIIIEDLIRKEEEAIRNKNNPVVTPPVNSPTVVPDVQGTKDFTFQDMNDFWRATGVSYQNGIYQVDLLKTCLENNASKTQDQWAEYSNNAISKNEFYVGNAQLYHSLFSSLFRNKDSTFKDSIEEARAFLQKSFNDYLLMTLTRINYKKSGKDEVIHDYNLPTQFSILEDIVGADGFVTQTNPQKELKSILDSNDIDEVNSVYNWITNQNLYLWRVNSKPKKDDTRVVRLYSSSDGAGLNCVRNPSVSNLALGVRRAKIFP